MIQQIAQDQSRTVYQRAADIAALEQAEADEPKARKPRKTTQLTNATSSTGKGLI